MYRDVGHGYSVGLFFDVGLVGVFLIFVKMRGFSTYIRHFTCIVQQKKKKQECWKDETSHEYHELIKCINASLQFYGEIKRFFIIIIALH